MPVARIDFSLIVLSQSIIHCLTVEAVSQFVFLTRLSYDIKINLKKSYSGTLRAIRINKNKETIDRIKEITPCTDCAGQFPAVCTDFGHLPRTNKIVDISHMFDRKLQTILLEISKCELVCANCHRLRTHKRVKKTYTATNIVRRLPKHNTSGYVNVRFRASRNRWIVSFKKHYIGSFSTKAAAICAYKETEMSNR